MRSARAAILIVAMLLAPLVVVALASLGRFKASAPASKPDSTSKESIFVCRARTADGERDFFTLVPPGAFFEQGLARECIVGTSKKPLELNQPITPENFSRNSGFVKFLHQVIAEEGPLLTGLKAEAQRVGDGPVLVLDLRTKRPEARDVIGVFQAKDGELVPGSYKKGPAHVLLSPDGFFRLDPSLHERLMRRMALLNEAHRKNSQSIETDDPQD